MELAKIRGTDMVKLDQQTSEQYTTLVMLAIKSENKDQFRELFLELHPTDQVDIFNKFSDEEKILIYDYLTAEEFTDIFQGMEVDDQKEVVRELHEMDREYASDMLNNLYADDLVSFLEELDDREVDHIIDQLEIEDAEEIMEILSYEDDTAGNILTTEYISIHTEDTAAQVLEHLRDRAHDAETIYYLYVVDNENHLVGVLSLRELLGAQLDQRVEDLMARRVISTNVNTDQEHVAKKIKKYDLLALPVVRDDNTMLGIVTVDDVIDIIVEEATEDFGEISAAKGSMDASLTSFQAAKIRAPWILILMILGFITAGIIGQFEDTLAKAVVLAGFIPMIMGSAGNTGTQALAVVVRSIAVGDDGKTNIGKLVFREFKTGVMLGVICGSVLFLIIPLIYKDFMVAAIVSLSLFFSFSLATMMGALIPLLINKLKIDPAVASGPFITALNDIIGLLVYFSIASMFFTHFNI